MKNAIAFSAGTIFSFGLTISGMINPDKVIGFLDIFGKWDYSLAFVMGGALAVNLVFFTLILKKDSPISDVKFDLPATSLIDWKLISGAALFGIGWGLVGICPGPAIVNLVTFSVSAFVFVGAMLVGVLVHRKFIK